MKITRNDKCPCGSDKKYKKCCMDSSRTFSTSDAQQQSPFFSECNSIDLLKSFAGLTLLAQNHGKNVRFEELSSICLRNFNDDKPNVSQAALTTFLNENYPSHYMEDPVTNLFTDLITFYGGDYIIFPGITEGGSYVPSKLLTAIYNWPDSGIPDWLKNNCMHAFLLILNLSDRIATRLRYGKYQFEEVENNLISIPDSTLLAEIKAAVTFSEEEITQLLQSKQIAREALNMFVLDIHDPELVNDHIEESPLLAKPIIHRNGEYIITSPATLSYALVDFIHSEANTLGCLPDVSNTYHNVIWNYTQLHLKQLGFSRIDIPTISENTASNIREAIYRFDDDKLAFVQYLTSGKQSHQERKQRIINDTLALPEYDGYQFMDISLISSMGQDLFFMYRYTENSLSIAMQIYDFETLVKLKEHEAFDLWNFANARDSQIPDSNMFGASFLDVFKVYKENDDSFYVSDDSSGIILHVEPGYAGSLYQEAKLLSDEHSVTRLVEGRLANIPVTRKDKYAPIYCSVDELSAGNLNMAVEGFPLPVWVCPNKNSFDIPPALRDLYFEMTDAIAFWLWQCQEFINTDLSHLEQTPIVFRFEFEQEDRFNSIERNFERDPELAGYFNISIDGNTISIWIPPAIIPYLYGADNQGERELTRQILLGINLLLEAQQKPTIESARINQIVDAAAPLGVKKKIFILDTTDNLLLDPSNLTGHRYLQGFNVNTILNSLIPGLGNLCPPFGEITDKASKTKLTRDVVMRVLLPMLQTTISQYPNEALLKRLINLNESLIHKREELRVKTATRIACFVTQEQQTSDLQDSLAKLNQTTIAVRCLIEHIAAEPVAGNKIVSTTAIDELIAIMNAIIDWGSIGDQIEFDLFEIEMGILPSGRIGISKQLFKEIFDPYYYSKSQENVRDAMDTFQQVFPQLNPIEGSDVPESLDNAFTEEFEISFSRLCKVVNDLGIIAYSQPDACATMLKKDLFIEINKHDQTYSEEEFNTAIAYLSLFNRGKIHHVPAGFDNIDISPWRFNRRLSLLRKPLILVDNPEDPDNPIVYWGLRQLLSSRMYWYDQCTTNRLRVREDGPVQKVLGKLAQRNGKKLVESVLNVFDTNDLIIDSEVPINPRTALKNHTDIGDVDILVIDTSTKTIYSLECKSMAPSRNIKEMIGEIDKLLGSGSDKGWIDKHVERDKWLKANLNKLSIEYSLDLSDYTVKSFFVTQEDMLTPYLKTRQLAIPFISLYNLKGNGLEAFN
ncbi:SEC-C domain-containing protein [Sphingobacterium sp. PCS056]|uniref:SEC-C domain-containing protein n=1 Tax=Sphingobacterium sp. PCS056 TaxID=2931400 RepID=UPI00200DD900|nr:SEC-C domain-containing protein [Sphingobacterium sp. PCS056]UPZ35534.1 SEC-C domain-containing protein [Sphingobacterium sp. PCS056]